jgi:hypothetical protein
VLLAIAFSIFIATVGDLMFEGFYPGHWVVIIGILFVSSLIAVIGIGAHQAAAFGGVAGAIEAPVLVSWFLFQAAIALLVLGYCAMVKSLLVEWRDRVS